MILLGYILNFQEEINLGRNSLPCFCIHPLCLVMQKLKICWGKFPPSFNCETTKCFCKLSRIYLLNYLCFYESHQFLIIELFPISHSHFPSKPSKIWVILPFFFPFCSSPKSRKIISNWRKSLFLKGINMLW